MGDLINGSDFLKRQMEDVVINMNNPNCIKCNECCSLITLITKEEYKRIKKYLMKNIGLYNECMALLNRHTKKRIIYMMCPFSTRLKTCSIYKIRPQICRDFHCDPSLKAEGFNKDNYIEGYTINDLFK